MTMADLDIPLSNDRRSRALQVQVSHPDVREDFLYNLFEKAGPVEKVIFKNGEHGNPNRAVLIYRYEDSVVQAMQSLQAAFDHYGMKVAALRLREISSSTDHDLAAAKTSSNFGLKKPGCLQPARNSVRSGIPPFSLFDQPIGSDLPMNDDVFSTGVRANTSVPDSPMFNSFNPLPNDVYNIWAPIGNEKRGAYPSPPLSAGWPPNYGSAFPFGERQIGVSLRDSHDLNEPRGRSHSERTSVHPRSRRIVVHDVEGTLPQPAPPRAQWNTLEFTGVTRLDARNRDNKNSRLDCKKCRRRNCVCTQYIAPYTNQQVANLSTGRSQQAEDGFASWAALSKLHL